MAQEILAAIKAYSIPAKLPDQSDYASLPLSATAQLAAKLRMPALKVEQTALQNNIVPERYARNLKTWSPEEQARLLHSSVAVVGLGGLGGAVVEILARAGIGSLRLADGDAFESHNLNRQLTSTCDLLGTSKSLAAKKRVDAINPSIAAQAYSEFLDKKNAARLIGTSDVVVDCLDDIKTRFVLAHAAKAMKRPMVSAAVGGLCGHVTTIFPEDHSLEMIYGNKDASSSKGVETSLGCLPQIVVMIAAIQTSEIFKILLKRGKLLRNRLFIADLEDNTFETLRL